MCSLPPTHCNPGSPCTILELLRMLLLSFHCRTPHPGTALWPVTDGTGRACPLRQSCSVCSYYAVNCCNCSAFNAVGQYWNLRNQAFPTQFVNAAVYAPPIAICLKSSVDGDDALCAAGLPFTHNVHNPSARRDHAALNNLLYSRFTPELIVPPPLND